MKLRVLISLFALLTAGCATSIWDSSRLTPVTNQAERIDLRGFSILPPPGENWYLSTEAPGAWGTPPPRAITFYKRLAGVPPTHTFFLMARSGDVTEPVTNLAELRDLVERTDHEERRRSGRFTILSSKLSVDGSFGAECVRTEVVMDERENPNPGVGGLVLVLSEARAFLEKDPSYPSGHTALGWGFALILSEIAPDRDDELLARGRAFGESRIVCNHHWYSDVV